MAEKRMFTKKITDDDNFIALSPSAQALYFHLNQGADDDGFNNQVTMAMFKAHASVDDLKVLMAKNYIIRFESGVIVIKHWRMHNTLRKDRYTPTNFQEELQQLGIKDNGAYTLGCHVVAKRLPQDSIVENSTVECNIAEDNIVCDPQADTPRTQKRFTPPTLEEVRAYCQERGNKVDPERFYDYYSSNGWCVGKAKMKDWKAAVRNWERTGSQTTSQKKPSNPFLAMLEDD